MDITPDRHLLFTDEVDYRFLERLQWFMARPGNNTYLTSLQQHFTEESGDIRFSEPCTYLELKQTMTGQEISHLRTTGIPLSELPDAGNIINIVNARSNGLNYSLPTKWIPAVLSTALNEVPDINEHRDDLLRLMIDGQTLEDELEALVGGYEDSVDYPGIDEEYAQDKFDLARRAGEIATQIVELLEAT